MDSAKIPIRNQDLRDALFTVLILIIFLLPLHKGLPEAASSINPGGGPLTFTALVKNLPDFPAAYTRLFNDQLLGTRPLNSCLYPLPAGRPGRKSLPYRPHW